MRTGPGSTLREVRLGAYREVILAAAERVFAEHGFDATRIQTVAEEAGVSVGTLYGVYGSKAELFSDVLTHRLPELLERAVARVDDDAPAVERLLTGLDAYVRFMVDHPDWLRIHLHEHAWGLGPTRATSEQLAAWREGLALEARVMAQAMEEGDVIRDDPTRLSRSIAAVQQVYLADWLDEGMKESPDAVARHLDRLVRMLLCVRRPA